MITDNNTYALKRFIQGRILISPKEITRPAKQEPRFAKSLFKAWAEAGFDFGVEFIFQWYLAPEEDFSRYLPLPKEQS